MPGGSPETNLHKDKLLLKTFIISNSPTVDFIIKPAGRFCGEKTVSLSLTILNFIFSVNPDSVPIDI